MADALTLRLTAEALAEVEDLSAVLQREGSIYTSGRRAMKRPHPAVALRADAWRRGLAGLRELGLTPAARGKVDVPDPKPGVNAGDYA